MVRWPGSGTPDNDRMLGEKREWHMDKFPPKGVVYNFAVMLIDVE